MVFAIKRIALILCALLLPGALLSGCSESSAEQGGKISVICTVFPQYDWTRRVIGDNIDRFELTLLLDNKVDLHSYQTSVDDIIKISGCDLFIYIGGHSDDWVEGVLRQAANPDMNTVNLMDILGDSVILDEHEHDDECEEEHEEGELHADEHIWLSLKNAKLITAAIADALAQADPENAQTYMANAEAYIAELSVLDNSYQAAVDAADVDTLVFADRFPFRYLVDDYGLNHYAAFHGCSAETEASFSTVISLANRVNQLGLKSVMVTESSDQSIARTVIESTESKNQQILVMDSMQSVTSGDVTNGMTYLSVMEDNLAILKEALE